MPTVYNGVSARPHWAGATSATDIHLEVYDSNIQSQFMYNSIMRGLTTFKSVQGQSNTWRGDRIGSVAVKGRKYGESLDSSPIRSEKLVVTVDTVSYVRVPIDFQDDWTAPDFRATYTRNIGTQQAKAFDEAHIIQLMKCADFVAPAHLKPAFNDGILKKVTLGGTDLEADADVLCKAHQDNLNQMIKRDLDVGRAVTLVSPDWFTVLLNHKKLMNVEFTGGVGVNDFAQRRIAVLNGVRVIETPRIPTANAAIVSHILGTAFNITADQSKRQMITFVPDLALVTVEAKPMETKIWVDDRDFGSVIDSYHMYTVSQLRPDAVACVSTEA